LPITSFSIWPSARSSNGPRRVTDPSICWCHGTLLARCEIGVVATAFAIRLKELIRPELSVRK